MRDGVLRRELVWSTPSGKHVTVRSSRMVSLEHRHLGVITMEVEVDTDAPVVISSQVLNRQDSAALDEQRVGRDGHDPRRARVFADRVLRARTHVEDGLRLVTGYQTTHSGMTMSVGVDHRVRSDTAVRTTTSWSEDLGKIVFSAEAEAGVPIRVEKYFTYHTSRHVPSVELVDRGLRSLDRAVALGSDALHDGQRRVARTRPGQRRRAVVSAAERQVLRVDEECRIRCPPGSAACGTFPA